MRKALVSLAFAASLLVPSGAQAAFPANVFSNTATPIACTTVPAGSGAVSGERWCGGGATGPATRQLTTIASFDGTPIDVAVYFPPAPATGPDGNFPVMGVYHGYGQQKFPPADPADPSATVQKWVTRGYAVFTMTARGFFGSCGPTSGNPPACSPDGYIHLMSNKFEVRDAQTILGLLADDGALISPTKIGATGISYGGGLSLQLGALKNRIYNNAGALVPWKSPNGKDMQIAATAPQWAWSDIAYGLQPNGSMLDYAALNPYHGPNNDRAIGTQKLRWNAALYAGGAAAGVYCSVSCPPEFDVTATKTYTDTGGPYNDATRNAALDALSVNHGAFYIDDSTAPAPALIQNGWNDDLFPVNEAIRYYNKVRKDHADTPINLYAIDFGHSPRSPSAPNTDVVTALTIAQFNWMDYYIRGIGSAPADPNGGVNTIASGCSDGTSSATPTSTAIVHAKNWASLAPGELSLSNATSKTVAAANGPFASPFSTGTTVCTVAASADTVGSASYTLPAQSSAYTLAGSPTVKVDTTVANANDQLLARLYDVDPSASTERLLTRAIVRPTGTGTKTQVFQLQPQQWQVVAGHQLKLELLTQDDGANSANSYARNATGQQPVGVANMSLRIPVLDSPGSGNVVAPAAKVLPAGYTLASDLVTATPTATATVTATPTYVIPTVTPGPYTVKITPGLSIKAKPKKDKKKPFKFTVSGKVNPKSAGKSACTGKVKIKTNKGGKATAKVKSSCAYSAKVKLAKKAGKKGKAKITAKFGGNSKLNAKSAKTTVKYGKKKKKSKK